MDLHRKSVLRSLALHEEVARRWREEPAEVRAFARRNIERFRALNPSSRTYLDEWARLLDGPESDLQRVLCSDDDHSATLRSCSPFAGLVSARERWRIWREVPG